MKIEIIEDYKIAEISNDRYIPLEIKFPNNSINPPLYYSIENKNSLLEMAFSTKEGILLAVTLVSLDSCLVAYLKENLVLIHNKETGHLAANLDLWGNVGSCFSQRFVKCSRSIRAKLSVNSILLVIGENESISTWIKNSDSLYFGLNFKREIINIYLPNLSEKIIHSFLEATNCSIQTSEISN